MAGKHQTLNFGTLVETIRQVHEHLAAQAGKAVNISFTFRNWLTGCYTREYEQNDHSVRHPAPSGKKDFIRHDRRL